MKLKEFSTQTCGKWILAGEHSVLRGSPAVVFPLKSRFFKLKFQPRPGSGAILLESEGSHSQETEAAFWACFEKACEVFGVQSEIIEGEIKIESTIPAGAGLGASASLCVALSRWMANLSGNFENEISLKARELENVFHGESSGVDVTVVSLEKPIRFVKGASPQGLTQTWTPKFFLSYSGVKGVTKDCVEKVQALARTQPVLVADLDGKMKMAVQLATESLAMPDSVATNAERLKKLVEAFELAAGCFSEWGLCNSEVKAHMDKIRKCGALAVKPTGSGQGGYCLSLWKSDPPEDLMSVLIPCF